MSVFRKIKRKIVIIRLIWIALLIYNLIDGITFNERKTPDEAVLTDAEYEIRNYESIEESLVSVYLYFDYPCQGKIGINAYNARGYCVGTFYEEFDTFYTPLYAKEGYGEAMLILNIQNGNIKSCDIESIETYPYLYFPKAIVDLAFYILIVLFGIPVILSFSLKCKLFIWDDRYIVVYAGRFKKEIFEDDVLKDRMNGKAAKLEYRMETGELVSARFHGFNNISLKVDDDFLNEHTV